MPKPRLSKRQKARHAIIEAANQGRLTMEPYRMKHLHRAVHRVRNRKLVKADVLRDAGFKFPGPNKRTKRRAA